MSLPARCLAAILLVLFAAALRAALPALELPFLLFIPALMAAGFFLGRGPGIFATALAAFLAAYLFIPPAFTLALMAKDWIATAGFTLVNLGIVVVCAALGESLIRREADLVALGESRALAAQSEANLRRLNETLEHRVRQEVAERSRTEDALRQSQKMEAVGQLTGGLAHDLNNMLAGITGSLELLKVRLAQGRLQELDRYVQGAEGAAQRAAALTHRLLAFSRRQALNPRPTNLDQLVKAMEELLRRTVGPEIVLDVVGTGGLWNTLVDTNQLENALLNLCLNARDAMPAGGRLTIETANLNLDEAFTRSRDMSAGDYVSLCVTDTGTGMSAELIQRVFEPFFTTKPPGQGTGLGLSMVYGFVRQSGGQVRVHSTPGQGTTVCLYLPRSDAPLDMVKQSPGLAEAPRAREGETVLVVDDEATVRLLIVEVLGELGYAAIAAQDAAEALAILRSGVRVDFLVTDVGLPGGMNGRQLAEEGRAARPGLKVLFITGYAEAAVLGQGHLEAGMQMLTKPFAMERLACRLRQLVGSP
ncbi:response regulator [Roseomonas sp. M0104]|uniref:histidine kinase n=1 Tax=Teichococcus coralli TaxID=2545983 RepID=A0A845BFF7_9PROT|nr:ATP-binding protein [Pseudoroseomonas coralli]MXP64830.1 response regulator [Pseudoroseomonas coralli]